MAVPPELRVPNRDPFAHCIQVDLAIVRGPDGQLDGRLVELQGFPSLYMLTMFQAQAWAEAMADIPGLKQDWTLFFGDFNSTNYIDRLRATIVGDAAPEEVILLDLDPPGQKTYPDFLVTKKTLGIDPVCPDHGRTRRPQTLPSDRRKTRSRAENLQPRSLRRTAEKKASRCRFSTPTTSTSRRSPSQLVLDLVEVHRAVSPSRSRAGNALLSDVVTPPEDLENYVLKPLFSFAGTGVKVDITRADLDAVPVEHRHD